MFTLFYRLPRLAALSILVILFGGLGALLSLGRQEDPTLVERFGLVVVTLPGADAERMEALIAEPLEAELMALPELKQVETFARAGVVQVSLNVEDDLTEAEVDDAWALVRQQVAKAQQTFPAGASNADITRFYIGASTMIVSLTWTGEGDAPLAVMRRLGLDLEDTFRRLDGTELTETYGMPIEEVRVIVDGETLAAAGVSVAEAARAIAAADTKAPAGRLRTEGGTIGVEVGGELDGIARVRSVPVKQSAGGSVLRVGDVASVVKGYEDPPTRMAFENSQRSVLVAGFISSNQRVDRWATSAHKAVDAFSKSVPPGIKVDVVFDQNKYTSARLNGLAQNLGFSALIVLAVLLFTMGWRSALVCATAMPLTVALVLILFNIFGQPLHQMSVTGLVISLGLLIDNAIVVVDDIDQWRAKGLSRLESIDRSLKHLFAPLAASTLTTALAFAPIAMLPGSAGEFIGMIGISVIYSITASFFISITIVPAIAGWFDRTRSWERGETRRARRWWRDGIAIDFISDGYRATIETVLRFPLLGVVICIAPAILGLVLMTRLPQQFFPPTERDQFQLTLGLTSESDLADTQAITQRATDLIMQHEGVKSVTWVLGEPSPRVYYNAFNNTRGVEGFASGWVQLDGNLRTRQVVADVQSELRREFPQARFLALPFEQGPPADAPIELVLRGADLEVLNRLGNEVRAVLAQTPGITFSLASLEMGAPTLQLQADEAATNLAGSRLVELAANINSELEGLRAGSVLEGTEELPVRIISANSRRTNLSDLQSKTIGASPGDTGTPLAALGQMELKPKTSIISRRDGLRTNQILAFLDPYTLPAPSLEQFQERLAASNFVLPPGYDMLIGGEAENSGEAVGNLAGVGIPLMLVMAGAIMLVFNSFRMMLLIIVTGVLSVFYAFFGVWLFNLPFGFNAIVGSLGLFGIAINGTIVVLSLLRANPAAMADDIIAQREVVVDATRHIIATTLTTMGGFVPILLSGDAFWMPLAAGIAGGVGGSALLALYFTPAVFRLSTMKPFQRLLGRRPQVVAQAE
ncbi:MAG: efflux RND transporter permease subunit [Hyphomonas sp.]|uniref:efflux RND transporter permease subunit n=1 Tax=Hyphomonas sp. TaxID=87 RepID=UPI0018515AF7|nr:efflux RND transporter permease subunit [Hyphomonas sp.]MBA3069756.1 efflux RND transporter permease subunit [Hyphomonas sp.]MBU4062597.1 efflux RND transporter permease subunit [Alphaproteobacteria bacterium]MBU4163948.1 efflux RND transporter permease subunit [Alphaproteobacteria bacterium]